MWVTSLEMFSKTCFNDQAGDVIGWKAFKDVVLNNAYIQIPSLCDGNFILLFICNVILVIYKLLLLFVYTVLAQMK